MRQSKGIFKFDNLSCKMHEKEQKVDENVYELWQICEKQKENQNWTKITNFIPKYFVLSLRIKQLYIEIDLSNKYAIFN